MPSHTFKGYVNDEPITFTLKSPDELRTQTFRCRQSIAGSALLDFISTANETDPASMARAVKGLLQASVVEGEWNSFTEFIDADDNGITLETLAELAGWLSSQYSGRPTKQ